QLGRVQGFAVVARWRDRRVRDGFMALDLHHDGYGTSAITATTEVGVQRQQCGEPPEGLGSRSVTDRNRLTLDRRALRKSERGSRRQQRVSIVLEHTGSNGDRLEA